MRATRRDRVSTMLHFSIHSLPAKFDVSYSTPGAEGRTEDGGRHLRCRIHDPGSQHHPAPNSSLPQLLVGEIGCLGVVGTPEQDNVNQTHAEQERHGGSGHDLVLAEEALHAHVSTADAQEDDGEGESGTPPASQQRRLVLVEGPCRWGIIPKGWGIGHCEATAMDEPEDHFRSRAGGQCHEVAHDGLLMSEPAGLCSGLSMSWIGYMQLQRPDIIFQPSSVLPGADTTARCDCSAGDTCVFLSLKWGCVP